MPGCASAGGAGQQNKGQAMTPSTNAANQAPNTRTGQAAVLAMLDRFHTAASKADADGYFGLFAPEGVFIGTDAGERWTVEQFKAYAAPYFAKGTGWTYVPRAGRRNVDFSPDGTVAWFDEILDHAKYGVCRGTGASRQIDGQWRVVQYHLTIPVPNELAERVVKMIKAQSAAAQPNK
jgi:hypothetical protein